MVGFKALAAAGLTGAAVAALTTGSRRATGNVTANVTVIPRGQGLRSSRAQTKDCTAVSIVSYNVLCDKFATPQRLPHVFPHFLNYEHRWTSLKRELSEFEADVVCLQEITIERWEEMRDYMSRLGYDAVVQLKPHEVKLAIFWQRHLFQLSWWEERSRVLIAELKASCTQFYVINAHLEGSPWRASDRVAQIRHALHRLEYHIETHELPTEVKDANVVVAGDFNSTDKDAPCIFLRQGCLPAGYTDPDPPGQEPATPQDIHHPFHFIDVYKEAHAVPPFTRKVSHRGGARLDFVWVTGGIGVQAVLRPLPLEHRDLVHRQGLPNHALPSDHLPVGAVLSIRNTTKGQGDVENESTVCSDR